ncbi:MAG: DUF962 domain-containing protein [Planctomycetota bacterium]|nr:MAG: DUF962 domain-containing protein [Planctomycetota bacterium]
MQRRFADFGEFYDFYLQQHSTPMCRRLHFVGSLTAVVLIGCSVMFREWQWAVAAPVVGYACAWIGHFVFERNRPATFGHPLYSFAADWVMFYEILAGRVPW